LVNCFSIFLIVVGALHLDKQECTAEPHIAPILIAMGALAIVLSVLDSCIRAKSSQVGEGETPPSPSGIVRFFNVINSLVKLVKFGLFIYLCVIVYRHYSEIQYNNPSDAENFCNRFLYLVAFWTLTLSFIIIGLVLIFSCCCCCCLLLLGGKK